MYIGIALLTDFETQNLGREISFAVENMTKAGIDSTLLPQHISLKQSFSFDGDIKIIESYFENFFKNISPFTVNIKGIDFWAGEKGIMFFDIEESSILKELHTKLCVQLKEQFDIFPVGFDGESWHFHSTLVFTHNEKRTYEEVFNEYKKTAFQKSFEAENVVIFCCLNDPTKTSNYFAYKIFSIGR